MDNANVRTVIIDAEPVAKAIVDAEEKYLAEADAGPDEAYLDKSGLPHFSAGILLRNLGQTVAGVSARDTQKYFLPWPGQIVTLIHEERDRSISHGMIVRAVACNRLMEMLRARK